CFASTCVGLTTIAADNLDARMCSEPSSKGLFCALGQQVYGSMLLQIDQDRAHALTTTKGPVIHAQDPWGRISRWVMAMQQGKHGVRTDRYTLANTVACRSFSTKRKAGLKQLIAQTIGSSCIGSDQVGQTLGEDLAYTGRVWAEEASNV